MKNQTKQSPAGVNDHENTLARARDGIRDIRKNKSTINTLSGTEAKAQLVKQFQLLISNMESTKQLLENAVTAAISPVISVELVRYDDLKEGDEGMLKNLISMYHDLTELEAIEFKTAGEVSTWLIGKQYFLKTAAYMPINSSRDLFTDY